MTKFLLGGAALAALVAIAPAAAQPVQAPMAPRAPMAQVETRAQVGAQVAALFQRLDANRDGFITRDEGQAAKAARGARKMQRTANRSPEQRAARRAAAFDRIDANRDGSISRAEFASAPGGQHERRLKVRTANNADGGMQRGRMMRRMGGGMGMAGMRGRMFDMADVNRDSRVSLQEATAAAYRRFDMADANRDGRITSDERMQVRQQMRVQRQPG